jgi:hypothetical protein
MAGGVSRAIAAAGPATAGAAAVVINVAAPINVNAVAINPAN